LNQLKFITLAYAIALAAMASGWSAEIETSEDNAQERKSLGEILGLNFLRDRFRILPLEITASDNEGDSTPATTSPNPADAILTNQEPAKPFIPATMVEGKLTSKMDVAYEVERLRSITATRSTKSARSPSSTLLAVLKENQEEKARLLRQAQTEPQTLIASKAAIPTPKPATSPQKPSTPQPVTVPKKSPDQNTQPFLLLAKLDSRKARGENGNAKSGEKEPKLALLLARNPNRARTSRKSETDPTAEREQEKATGPIRQVSRTGKQMEFSAVEGRGAPFHVFDIDPSETFLIELDGGKVGRVQEQGKEWAWLQLESGLMGVMRNKHLRPASREEVMEFLAIESAEGSGPGHESAIGVMELDLDVRDLPLSGSMSGSMSPSAEPQLPVDGSVSPPKTNSSEPLN
tara:strand:- start:8225 stop:9439 length:1215 start_codon:yes stop_codon:yes gene_type:complete